MIDKTIYHYFLNRRVIVNYKNGQSAIGILKDIQVHDEIIIYIKGDYKEFIIKNSEIADIKASGGGDK